jgi:hypothetical protein
MDSSDEDAMVETKAKKKRTRKRRNRDYVKRSRKRHRTVEVNRVKLWTEGQVYVQWVGDHEDSWEPAENFKALCLVDDEVVDEDGQSAWFREVREKATRTSRRSKNGGWHNAHAGGIGDRCLSTSDSEVPEGAGATREDLAPEFKAIDKRCVKNAVSLALPCLMLSEDQAEYKCLGLKLEEKGGLCPFENVVNIQEVPFPTTAVQATRVPQAKLSSLGTDVGTFVVLADSHCGAVIREAGSDYATFYETDPRWPDPITFRDLATVFSTLPHINGLDDAYELVSSPVTSKRRQKERKRKLELMSTQGRSKRRKRRRP